MVDVENLLGLSTMRKHKKSSKVLIKLIVLVITILLGIFGFLMFKNSTSNGENQNIENKSVKDASEVIPTSDSQIREKTSLTTIKRNIKTSTTLSFIDDDYDDGKDVEFQPKSPSSSNNPFKSHSNYEMFAKVPPTLGNPVPKVQNGFKAEMNEFPWTVAMFGVPLKNLSATPKYFCAGSLIHESWIVTAGHCVPNQHDKKFKISSIRLGDHNLTSPIDCDTNDVCSPPFQEYFEDDFKVFSHENYSEISLQNDIGLIKLLRPADTKQKNVKLIRLPLDDDKLPKNLIVAGWGLYDQSRKASVVLVKGLLKTFDADDCHEYFNNTINYSTISLTSNQFCARGKNQIENDILTCKGDSGAAAFNIFESSFTLYGFTSWGTGDKYRGCGDNREPTVFTRIYEFIDWILDVTGENKN